MAEHQLKISADTKKLKQSLTDLSKFAKKELGSSKIELFSKDTHKLIKGEAKNALNDIKKVSANIKSEIEKQLVAVKKTTRGTKEQRREVEKLLSLQKDLLKTKKAEADLGKMASFGIKTPGKSLFGGGGGAGGMLGGVGKLLGGAGGLIGGALLGAGAFGISRGMKGMQQFQSEIPNRLLLRGRGVKDFGLDPLQKRKAAEAGMGRGDVEQQRFQAINAFGREGSGTNDIIKRGLFERGSGLQSGTMTGIGSQLRGQMGGAQANQTVMKLQASLIASGIDDAIGPYLETAANMLMSINESGMSNQAEILQTLSMLTRATDKAPEIISKNLSGLDAAIKNSSDDRNAFLQVAFAKAGIGGRTIGGTQAAISGGLFGSGVIGRLDKKTQNQFNEMGLGASTKDRAKAIIDEMKVSGFNLGPNASGHEKIQAGTFMQQFGAKSAPQGYEMIGLLQKIIKGDTAAEKKLKNLTKDPQAENLADIKKSTEGQLSEAQALHKTILSEMGEKLTPISIIIAQTLERIDTGIGMMAGPVSAVANEFLKKFGITTATEKLKGASAGDIALGSKDLKSFTPEEKAKLRETLKSSKSKLETKMEEVKSAEETPWKDLFSSKGYTRKEDKLKELENQLKTVKENLQLKGLLPELNTGFDKLINTIKETTLQNMKNRDINTNKGTSRNLKGGKLPGRTTPS